MKLVVKGSVTAGVLLLTACQTANYQKLDISEQFKDPNPDKILIDSAPELLTSKELESLLRQKDEVTETSQKADRLFSSAFVDNSHYRSTGSLNIMFILFWGLLFAYQHGTLRNRFM